MNRSSIVDVLLKYTCIYHKKLSNIYLFKYISTSTEILLSCCKNYYTAQKVENIFNKIASYSRNISFSCDVQIENWMPYFTKQLILREKGPYGLELIWHLAYN